jgi:hypothetical protein
VRDLRNEDLCFRGAGKAEKEEGEEEEEEGWVSTGEGGEGEVSESEAAAATAPSAGGPNQLLNHPPPLPAWPAELATEQIIVISRTSSNNGKLTTMIVLKRRLGSRVIVFELLIRPQPGLSDRRKHHTSRPSAEKQKSY